VRSLTACENHEGAVWRDLAAAAGSGCRAREQGHAFVMAAPACPVWTFNRVLWTGGGSPAIEELEAAAAWYAELGVDRYWLQLGVGPATAPVERWLSVHRCVFAHRSVLLARSLRPPLPIASSRLEVRRAGADAARDFGGVAARAFGWPQAADGVAACVMGRAGWRHYFAWEGAVPVGCGASYEVERIVWLGFGGVLATHRRRGGQAALIARRLADAAGDADTAIVDVSDGSASHRNCLRAGFWSLGVRPIYRVAPRRGLLRRLFRG